MSEQRLRLAPTDTGSDHIHVTLECLVDPLRVDGVKLVHRNGHRSLEQRIRGVDGRKLIGEELKSIRRAADGKSGEHGNLSGLGRWCLSTTGERFMHIRCHARRWVTHRSIE